MLCPETKRSGSGLKLVADVGVLQVMEPKMRNQLNGNWCGAMRICKSTVGKLFGANQLIESSLLLLGQGPRAYWYSL